MNYLEAKQHSIELKYYSHKQVKIFCIFIFNWYFVIKKIGGTEMKRNKLIQCIALLSLLSVFFLQSCDWVTTSKLLINNRTKDDIILYFFKSDSVISTIVNDSYSKEGDNIIDVKNGLLLVNNTLSIVESHKNFGPPVPYNPFYRYDSIEIVNNSNQHKTIISKEDFKIFKNGKHNFIYFYEYLY